MINTERLREIQMLIEDLREEAMIILDQARSQGDEVTYERARTGWSAEIEMALTTEHQWVGTLEMDTLEETILSCEALNEEPGFFGNSHDWDHEAGRPAHMRDEDWN